MEKTSWVMWKFNRKNRIGNVFKRGTDEEEALKLVAETMKDKEHYYAIRYNLEKTGD
jgi:hypothetical protein